MTANPAKFAGPNRQPPPRAVRAFTRAELDALAAELPRPTRRCRSSPPRPACAPRSGWHLSGETWTAGSASVDASGVRKPARSRFGRHNGRLRKTGSRPTSDIRRARRCDAAFLKPCSSGGTYAIDIKMRGMTCNLARQIVGRISNSCAEDCGITHHGRDYFCNTRTASPNIYWRCATTSGLPFRLVHYEHEERTDSRQGRQAEMTANLEAQNYDPPDQERIDELVEQDDNRSRTELMMHQLNGDVTTASEAEAEWDEA
jgi:hypothetical protein